MGGSRPSAPVTIMPAPTAPTFYQSLIPKESFEDAAGYLKRIQGETAKIQGQRYQEVGTPAELGARMAGRRLQEIEAYSASLPRGDKYLQQTTGISNSNEGLKQSLAAQKYQAMGEYGNALARMNEVPEATIAETPSWAKRPDEIYFAKQQKDQAQA